MKPQEFLRKTTAMAKQLKDIRRKAVFVGLPSERVGGKVYGDGNSIIQIGAIHEFGGGNTPRRSFLREPFRIHKGPLNIAIAKEFEAIAEGRDVDVALGRIGAVATNISKGAFTSLGYGTWDEITIRTMRRKGSSQTLIDTGLLRGSLTWVIRGTS